MKLYFHFFRTSSFLFLSPEGKTKKQKESSPAASPEAKKHFQMLSRKNSLSELKQFASLNALSSTFLHASFAKAGYLLISDSLIND